MEPGHSVRTIEDRQREAEADITVETAMLESRWLAGSRALMKKFDAATKARLDPRAFFRAKRVEMQQRHARYQDTPYALEPNCKESPGGLRDPQVILWMARAAGFGDNWRQVAQAGLLTPSEARATCARPSRPSSGCASNCTCWPAAAKTACCSTCNPRWPRSTASTPPPRGAAANC